MEVENNNLPDESSDVSAGADEFEKSFSYLDTEEAESDDDTSEVDDAEDDIDDDVNSENHNKKSGVQKRFNKLTNEKKQAQAERDSLKAELEEIKRMLKYGNKPQQQEEVAKPSVKPKIEDFDYDQEAYLDALTDWKIEQRELSKSKEKEASAEQENLHKARKAVEETVKNYREKCDNVRYKDFKETITALHDLPALQDDTAQYIMESDIGPDVHYYLGKNPAVWTKISKLSKVKQIAEIVKIEKAIESKKNNFKQKELADPISPINGKGSENMRKTRNLENVQINSLADYKRLYKRD